jgi:serine/threonine protein kinase
LPDEGALVVPFIDGKDGNKILSETGPLKEELFLKMAATMLGALAYSHEMRVAHRDLKPGNILIDKRDHAYLIDFGIAKEMGGTSTKTTHIALTPQFAAPERQSGDRDYNPFLSDIYEMGVTLFNFATNEMPYRNPKYPNAGEWGGSAAKKLSPPLTRILKKATLPVPEFRYQTATQMLQDLRKLKTAYRKQGKWKYAAMIAGAFLMMIIGFVARDFMPDSAKEFPETGLLKNYDSLKTQAAPIKAASAGESQLASGTNESDDQRPTKLKMEDGTNKSINSENTGSSILPPDVNIDKTGSNNRRSEEKVGAVISQEPVPAEKSEKNRNKEKTMEGDALSKASKFDLDGYADSVSDASSPPQIPKLSVHVEPASDNAKILIDGRAERPDSEFDIEPGAHEIKIYHPDFPILRGEFSIRGMSNKREYDLNRQFASARALPCAIGTYHSDPPNSSISFYLNGKKRAESRTMPVQGIKIISGSWRFEFGINPVDDRADGGFVVDSFLVLPDIMINGNSAELDLTQEPFNNLKAFDILLFWSQRGP